VSGFRDPAPGRFRLVDRIYMAYFGLNALLLLHPNRPDNWPATLLLHAVYVLGIPLLVRFSTRHALLGFVREWYPILGITFMYGELQYLNQILRTGYHDALVMEWEMAIFGRQMATDFRAMLPWKPLGEVIHFGYFCYYLTLPALFIPLWLTKRYREFRVAMSVVGATYLFCYLWYIYFPVTGPFWQLPKPDADSQGWVFPQLTYSIVSAGSSRGSAFPSSHIAASIAVLAMAKHFYRPSYYFLFAPVLLLTVGTVYGGFHYAIDAVAGLAVGLLFDAFGRRLVERVDGAALGAPADVRRSLAVRAPGPSERDEARAPAER
jgi:hypothetical protein